MLSKTVKLTPGAHLLISKFFIHADIRSAHQRQAYLGTQLRCFKEEIAETAVTLDKTFDTHGQFKEQLCDDIVDVLFSGIGALYTLEGDMPFDSLYEFHAEYLMLLRAGNPETDELDFIMKNEVKNMDAMYAAGVRDKHSYVTSIHRVMAAALLIAEQHEIDSREGLEIVIKSNMSKFDISEADALLTKEKYKAMGIVTKYTEVEGRWITRVDGDQLIDGKEWPDEKIIKSHLWTEPTFGYL